MTICYRVVTEAAYHARRAVRHIGHGIAHHAAVHPVAAIVSVVCIATPAVLWASLPPVAPVVSEVCCVFRTTPPDPLAPSPQLVSPAYRFAPPPAAPDWAADKWWRDRTDYLPDAPVGPDPVLKDSLITQATDIPAPWMGWIVLLPLALRRRWK